MLLPIIALNGTGVLAREIRVQGSKGAGEKWCKGAGERGSRGRVNFVHPGARRGAMVNGD